MVGWIILGVIVLILVVINMIRIGADLAYENGEFRLSAKVAGLKLQLIPRKKTRTRRRRKKSRKRRKKRKKKRRKKKDREKIRKKRKRACRLA